MIIKVIFRTSSAHAPTYGSRLSVKSWLVEGSLSFFEKLSKIHFMSKLSGDD